MRICSVEGCTNKHSCHGYCQKHVLRWKKHGDPLFEYQRQKYKYSSSVYKAEYFAWKALQRRCLNSKCDEYKIYGARGITVCERWLGDNGFDNFMEDMGPRPEGYSIDRIDVNGNYCPENCRWANVTTQANNRRTNRYITINNRTQTIMEWARETGLSWDCIHDRIEMGWSGNKILSPHNGRQHLLAILGETHPISYWVDKYDITRNALYFRIKNGWPEEKWLQPIRRKRKSA